MVPSKLDRFTILWNVDINLLQFLERENRRV